MRVIVVVTFNQNWEKKNKFEKIEEKLEKRKYQLEKEKLRKEIFKLEKETWRKLGKENINRGKEQIGERGRKS